MTTLETTPGPNAVVRKTSEGYATRFERDLLHPVETVWGMLTQPSEIGRWYVRTDLDPHVGGRIVEHHDHVGATAEGRVSAYAPPRLFEHTWWSDRDVLRWELGARGSGCRLVMTHRTTGPVSADGVAGWHIFLDVLEDVLGGARAEASRVPRGTVQGDRFVETEPGTGRWLDHAGLSRSYAARIPAAWQG